MYTLYLIYFCYLFQFHNVTGGSMWNSRFYDQWLNNSIHYCFWYGITCNEDGFVTSIGLSNKNLTGCPYPVQRLTYLQALCLPINKIDCQ